MKLNNIWLQGTLGMYQISRGVPMSSVTCQEIRCCEHGKAIRYAHLKNTSPDE